VNAAGLLTTAEKVLREPPSGLPGLWPRAVALLTRQALEKALEEFWDASPATAGMTRCSRWSQFACLPAYLDPGAARRASCTWAALSNACHYHAYELAPTAAELTAWIGDVAGFMTSTGQGAWEAGENE
jgi:hypothetical protein